MASVEEAEAASVAASNTSLELVKVDSPEQKVKCVVVATAPSSKLKRGRGGCSSEVDVQHTTSGVWWDPSTQDSPSRRPLIAASSSSYTTRGRRVSLLGRVLQHRQTSKHNANRPDSMDTNAGEANLSDPER